MWEARKVLDRGKRGPDAEERVVKDPECAWCAVHFPSVFVSSRVLVSCC